MTYGMEGLLGSVYCVKISNQEHAGTVNRISMITVLIWLVLNMFRHTFKQLVVVAVV